MNNEEVFVEGFNTFNEELGREIDPDYIQPKVEKEE